MRRARWLTAVMALMAGGAVSASAQARTPIVQSLDLRVPRQPELVRIEGKALLVYELHLTNLQRTRVTLTRIQVRLANPSSGVLADLRDTSLARMMGPPGTRGLDGTAHVLEPGSRAVAYFWIPLAADLPAPARLRHEVEMDVARRDAVAHVSFEGGEAEVSRDEAPILAPPLRNGPWAALYFPDVMGGHRTVFYSIGGTARLPGRFAIDFARPAGSSDTGLGEEVLAVASGDVAAASDDMPDNVGEPAPSAHNPENASGNFVVLRIGAGRFVHYEHLQHGSITVRPGDRVRTGQVIARLGNSGSSTIGPHLHFHVADGPSALGAEGVPFVFREFDVLGGRVVIDGGAVRWVARDSGASGPRAREGPGANRVVRFP